MSEAATGQAWGKVILLGEHAVVFGEPALAAAIPLTVRMQARSADAGGIVLEGADVPDDPRVRTAATLVGETIGVRHARVAVTSQLPAGGGLGSSAAFAVALARALLGLVGEVDEALVARAAMASEALFHGRPSGVDHTVCARGGIVAFRRGEPPEVQAVVAKRPLELVLGLTGRVRATAKNVASFAARLEADPSTWTPVVQRLGDLARGGVRDVETGALEALGDRMNEAQALLVRGGVSSPELDAIVEAARGADALGAKLTGAGGGGAAVALVREAAPVVAAIRRAGFEALAVRLGETR